MKNAMLLVALVATGLLMLTGCKKPESAPQTAMTPPPAAAPDSGTNLMEAPPPPPPAAIAPPTPSPIPEAVPANGHRVYVVKPGDTLWKISGKVYGKSSRDGVSKIVAANPGLDAGKIKVGQQLTIPE